MAVAYAVFAHIRRTASTTGARIRFTLDKWYLDCVSAEGDVLICYAAKLRCGPLKLNYGARITKAADAPLVQTQSFSFGRLEEESGAVTWRHDSLKVDGRWAGVATIGQTLVVDDPSGTIEWQCPVAKGTVEAHVDGQPIVGTGYVEKLSMTIPPWKLPFTELRWGRYISDDCADHVVWIDLLGRTRRNWIWINSGEAVAGTVDDKGVRTNAAALTFESSCPVRADDVAQTLLGTFDFLKALLPRELRAIQEDKRLSSCVLVTEGLESRGFSINEVVKWG